MAYTKGEIRGLTKTEVLSYLPTVKLDDRMIDLNVRRAEMDVFTWYANQAENFFRTTFSAADGAQLPVDFYRFANEGNIAGVPAHYIEPDKIGFRTTNKWDLATATSPDYLIYDQVVHTLPNTSTILISYVQMPADNSDPAIADNAASTMPDELKYVVQLGAARRCFQHIIDYSKQLQLSEAEQQNAVRALENYGALYTKQQQQLGGMK